MNNVTKNDSCPVPKINDCSDQIGKANYATKIDKLKGYRQVGLSEKAKAM